MRTVSIHDLHTRTSEILREVGAGEPTIVERRGTPIAELRPVAPKRQLTEEALDAILEERRRARGEMPMMSDCSLIIQEDRNR